MSTVATALDDLPDELLLHVVQHLRCINSLEPQSTAFKQKAEEKARQCENRVRQLALHSLCLANRHLRRIATPTLYASFVGSATRHGLKPLQLFHRTITGSSAPLADHLEYIENRLSDYLGNSLYDDTEEDGAVDMVLQYFYLLADIVSHAPNIQRLSVVSLETIDVSFWDYILPDGLFAGGPPLVANHGFPKLQSLCFQIHTRGHGRIRMTNSFSRIFSAMTLVPVLRDLRASGVMSSDFAQTLTGQFKKLTRIEITECVLELDEVISIWAACDELRHIVCEWAFLNYASNQPSDLYEGLLRHCETLEYLHLDMREVRVLESPDAQPNKLGSLQPFEVLTSLTICERALLGTAHVYFEDQIRSQDARLSELLPAKLEKFVLLMQGEVEHEADEILLDAEPLLTLSNDCPQLLPDLKVVLVQSRDQLIQPTLTKAFEDRSVRFGFVKEAQHESHI
jgi:hypothetical protein